jgi:hypothetical protein
MGFVDARRLPVVPGGPQDAASYVPCHGTLDDSATADDDEALYPAHAPDDPQRDARLAPRPCDDAPGVVTVRFDGLDKVERPTAQLTHSLGAAVAILDVRASRG